MARQKVRTRQQNSVTGAKTLCMGMVAQVATLGWSFVRIAEAMSADELTTHIRAVDQLSRDAVAPDAVVFVRTILERELDARRAGKLVRVADPPGIENEAF
jgi:hypothetical protein